MLLLTRINTRGHPQTSQSNARQFNMRLDDISCVVLEDFFVKSPPPEKFDQLKSWHRRYFALVRLTHDKLNNLVKQSQQNIRGELFLVYWEHKTDRDKGKKPLRTIAISKDDAVYMREHPFFSAQYPHVLAIYTKTRQYYLCAYSETQKKLWYDSLTQLLQLDSEFGMVRPITETEQNEDEPIYASLLDVLDDDETRSCSSCERFNTHRASDSSCWRDFHSVGNKNRDSGISSITNASKSSNEDENMEREPRLGRIHSLLTDTDDSSSWSENGNLYERMDELVVNKALLKSRGEERRFSGTDIATKKKEILENESLRRYSSPFLKIAESTEMLNTNFYDIPTSPRNLIKSIPRRGYKKLTFYDITLEIPSNSVVKITQNELRVKTSEREWTLTKGSDLNLL